MKTTVYVQDITCDSCVRVIERVLKRIDGVKEHTIHDDAVVVEHDARVTAQSVIEAITNAGYRASSAPLPRFSLKQRWSDFWTDKKKYALERKMFVYSLFAFVALLLIEAAAYALFFRATPGFFAKYAIWLFYLDISVVTVAAALWHLRAYKTPVTSMTGMMLGMTMGMQAGFMIGAVLGATNGMFIGSLGGMLLAAALGAYAGRDASIMGALQGLMSGLMGGTMGAMITVMMFTDHVLLFMPFYMALNVVILWGMSFMLYEEAIEGRRVTAEPADFTTFFSYVFVMTVILVALMVYGPKSLLVSIV